MTRALDTNVVIDLLAGETSLAASVAETLNRTRGRESLVLSPFVYAELAAFPGRTESALDKFLEEAGIAVDWLIGESIYRNAGRAFRRYASRRVRDWRAQPRRIATDFFIGAHAASTGALVTRDARFYETNFPGLRIVSP